MTWLPVLQIMLGGLVALMALGLPVAVAFFGINMVGAVLFLGGEAGLGQFTRNLLSALANFSLSPIPLFILMGEVLFHTGLAFKAVDAIDRLISKVPGRLSIVSVIGGTVFASLSGSTIANTAMLGSTLLPDMLKRGYHPSIAMGPIMATGGIAMLIPPSALAVVLGSLAGLSISKLLIAGIIPGLLMSVLFLGYIVLRCSLNPALAPAYDVEDVPLWDRVRPFLVQVVPLFGIFLIVVGSIIAGWATPTESAALGSVASMIAAICYRSLSWKNLVKSLRETAKITVMILFIIAASITFSQVLAISGAADGMVGMINSLNTSPLLIVLAMMLILLFLGCFMEQVSILLITVPLFYPVAATAQIDPIWLGIMMLIAIEIGLTTPPFGILVFVMKGIAPAHITLMQVFRAALPFIGLALLVLGLIMAFPQIVLWLTQFIE